MSEATTTARDVRKLPKAHLHVHLESAVRWSTLAEIGAANGIEVPEHLRDGRYAFAGFTDFVDQNDLVRRCLHRPEDFRRVAVEFCADEAAQGTRYAEVSFTAAAHGERVGDLDMPLASVLDGLAEGGARYGIEWRVLLDHSRRRPIRRAWQTVDLGRRYADAGVVGVGLAGDESYPAEPFAEVFATAAANGLRITHHAGEAAGADSIRAALAAGAERLGHGIRALDDPELAAELRDRGIALEVCPSSNVALGFAPSLAAHPLPRLRAAGLAVTVNTDIPSMIGVTTAEEYTRVRDTYGYTDADLADLARTSVDASFAPAGTKTRIRAEIDRWLANGHPA
jgi:adenosine deaminase